MLTSHRVMMIKQKIIDYHGRVENIRLYDKEPPEAPKEQKKDSSTKDDEEKDDEEENKEPPPPLYKTYDDPSMTIYDIFKEYGFENKKEIDKPLTLWYDFTPYNSKDPVLLCLMIKDPDTGKTI